MTTTRSASGYTLVELMVAVGLFAIVMLLSSGAYLIMIGITRQTQATATGINNLAFALETMTRNIRTGTGYGCNSAGGGDCSGGTSFYFTNAQGTPYYYQRSGSAIVGPNGAITESSVTISSLIFYVYGTPKGDGIQPRVTVMVTGSVKTAPGKPDQTFTIQTGATMRGSDL
jgi:prepilin-type N-terminal cleavage/methylation domain-containing protein